MSDSSLRGVPETTRGTAAQFEDYLSDHRAGLILFLLALIFLNIEYWIISNLASIYAGSPGGPAVEPTLIAAEIGLTLGTIALAAAAFVQARAATDQVNQARAQTGSAIALTAAAEEQVTALKEQTRALLTPHLRIEVWGVSVYVQGESSGIRQLPVGDWLEQGTPLRAFQLLNSGPGVACELNVRFVGINSWASIPFETTEWRRLGLATLGPNQSTQLLTQDMRPGSDPPPEAYHGAEVAVIVQVQYLPDIPAGNPPAQVLRAEAIAGLKLDSWTDEENNTAGDFWKVLGDTEARELLAKYKVR